MERMRRIAFSITGRPRIQTLAASDIEQRDREANNGGKDKNNVGHVFSAYLT
jgi:hypothetical protein